MIEAVEETGPPVATGNDLQLNNAVRDATRAPTNHANDEGSKATRLPSNMVQAEPKKKEREKQVEKAVEELKKAIEPMLGKHAGRVTDALQEVVNALIQEVRMTSNLKQPPKALETAEKKQTWADRAAAGLKTTTAALPTRQVPQQPSALASRKSAPARPERMIGINTKHDGARGRSEKEICSAIRATRAIGSEETVSVKAIGEKRFNVLMASAEARNNLIQSAIWQDIFGEAYIGQEKYTVIIHGVKEHSMAGAAWEKEILEENEYLHFGLEKANPRWKNAKMLATKGFGSVIIEAASAEAADAMIEHGLIVRTRKVKCTKYQPQWDFKQCFKCKGYGHISNHCAKERRCGRCVGNHFTADCPMESTEPFCVNCRKRGHKADSWSCQSSIKYKARIDAMRMGDSGKYGDLQPTQTKTQSMQQTESVGRAPLETSEGDSQQTTGQEKLLMLDLEQLGNAEKLHPQSPTQVGAGEGVPNVQNAPVNPTSVEIAEDKDLDQDMADATNNGPNQPFKLVTRRRGRPTILSTIYQANKISKYSRPTGKQREILRQAAGKENMPSTSSTPC